jgi:hypothetical protein
MLKLYWNIHFNEGLAKSKLRNRSAARLREAGRYFKERIEVNAPVDTGKLRQSVKLIVKPDGSGLHLFCDVEYAIYVEFGHVTPSGTWVPPNPFIRKSSMETMKRYPFLKIYVTPTRGGKRGR